MKTIAFVVWDGAGNVAPTLAVATELHTRGHRVIVQGHDTLAERTRALGLDFRGFPTSRQWDATVGGGSVPLLRMMASRAMGRDVVNLVDAEEPDTVVVDCMLFGVMRALHQARRPYIVFEHVCDGFLRKAARGPFGIGLRLFGLRPLDLIDAATDRLCVSVPALDRGHGVTTHVGPTNQACPNTADTPTVLISLSTYLYPGLADLWKRILDGVDGLDARVVATTGPAIDPASLRVPQGVEIHRWLDHSDVLPQATLCVGHGGHGTTIAALAHDVPMLVLPLDPTGDQPFLAESVENLGVGQRLSRKAKPDEIGGAITEMLDHRRYHRAAANLGAEIRKFDGRRLGADLVEAPVRSA